MVLIVEINTLFSQVAVNTDGSAIRELEPKH